MGVVDVIFDVDDGVEWHQPQEVTDRAVDASLAAAIYGVLSDDPQFMSAQPVKIAINGRDAAVPNDLGAQVRSGAGSADDIFWNPAYVPPAWVNVGPAGGDIQFKYADALDAVEWIRAQLALHSPIGGGNDRHPGQYEHAHQLYVDGELVLPHHLMPDDASEYVFINPLPYAGKIERGESPQDPSGVYQGVAALAAQLFAGAATIAFEYRIPPGGKYQSPAIVITPKD